MLAWRIAIAIARRLPVGWRVAIGWKTMRLGSRLAALGASVALAAAANDPRVAVLVEAVSTDELGIGA